MELRLFPSTCGDVVWPSEWRPNSPGFCSAENVADTAAVGAHRKLWGYNKM